MLTNGDDLRMVAAMKLFEGKWMRLWARLLCLVVSMLTLWLIFRRIDISAVFDVFLDLHPGYFLLAFAIFGFDLFLAAWRWHLMLRLVNGVIHPMATIRTVFIGHFFNTLLLGPAGGDVAKSVMYGRWYRLQITDLLASSFLDRILGGGGQILFVLLTVGLAAIGGVFSMQELQGIWSETLWILGGVTLAVMATGFIARRRLREESAVVKTLDAFISGARQLLKAPKLALRGLALSFLVQVFLAGVLAVCLQAVSHEPLPWAKLLWTFPLISLISAVPISFSGAGLREGASLVLLGYVGISASDAVAASLLTLVVYLIWAAVGGAMLMGENRRLRKARFRMRPRSISVVIPAFNEEAALPRLLEAVAQIPEITETIVVDGGSSDATVEIARKRGCRILQTPKGRGHQLRQGAIEARGDVVLLVHADTWLPPEAGKAVLNCLRDATIVGGAFWKVFEKRRLLLLGSRFRCAIRLYGFGRVAGDQCLFARREILEAVGGVPDMPLMEEFELCRLLRSRGRLALASAAVVTSTRRFERRGIIRTYLRMARVTTEYYLGVPVQKLEKLYEKE